VVGFHWALSEATPGGLRLPLTEFVTKAGPAHRMKQTPVHPQIGRREESDGITGIANSEEVLEVNGEFLVGRPVTIAVKVEFEVVQHLEGRLIPRAPGPASGPFG